MKRFTTKTNNGPRHVSTHSYTTNGLLWKGSHWSMFATSGSSTTVDTFTDGRISIWLMTVNSKYILAW